MKAGWQTKTLVVLAPDKIIRGQAATETHSPDITTVVPAHAGTQQLKNAFCLTPLDSRLRGNDGTLGGAR
jgi:hypothetical protein